MRLHDKLERGEAVALLVLGDSIACGDDAPSPAAEWLYLLREAMIRRYGSQVKLRNLSQGGNTIRDARAWLGETRDLHLYDLVILAVGVNDAGAKLSLRRLRRERERIRRTVSDARTDLLVVTPLEPTNANVQPYTRILRTAPLVADVTRAWPGASLLANGINHPDADGHRLYANVVGLALRVVPERLAGDLLEAPHERVHECVGDPAAH